METTCRISNTPYSTSGSCCRYTSTCNTKIRLVSRPARAWPTAPSKGTASEDARHHANELTGWRTLWYVVGEYKKRVVGQPGFGSSVLRHVHNARKARTYGSSSAPCTEPSLSEAAVVKVFESLPLGFRPRSQTQTEQSRDVTRQTRVGSLALDVERNRRAKANFRHRSRAEPEGGRGSVRDGGDCSAGGAYI
jgi:hypothetical protein